jgi:hypothetical protein
MAYLLKAGAGEPKKQPLLVNGSETTVSSVRDTMEKRDIWKRDGREPPFREAEESSLLEAVTREQLVKT